jgi:trans-aconitate methyltransferase
MRLRDAIGMIADSNVAALGPTTWADLGCGTGTFTLALAELLAAGSVIHAMDRDAAALRKIPSTHGGVSIATHRGDFTSPSWPFPNLDGILLANSLHYYEASRWVPHPVSRHRLVELFAAAGYPSITILASRPSVYRRAALYAVLATSDP